ncbi:hypothetical protein [Secundilactobacillus muriivasis]
MRVLISDVRELTLDDRAAEIEQFLAKIGYQISEASATTITLANDHTSVTASVPVVLQRYDRDHFLSVTAADGEQFDLPYVKQPQNRVRF